MERPRAPPPRDLHLSVRHLTLSVSAASVTEEGLEPCLPDLLEPPLNTPPSGLRGACGLFDGLPGQNSADGHQTLADPGTAFAGKRGPNFIFADP